MFMRSRVDWVDLVSLRIAGHLTATNHTGTAASAVTKSRHSSSGADRALLWSRSLKKAAQQGSLDE
jgi:hypothetical protein